MKVKLIKVYTEYIPAEEDDGYWNEDIRKCCVNLSSAWEEITMEEFETLKAWVKTHPSHILLCEESEQNIKVCIKDQIQLEIDEQAQQKELRKRQAEAALKAKEDAKFRAELLKKKKEAKKIETAKKQIEKLQKLIESNGKV